MLSVVDFYIPPTLPTIPARGFERTVKDIRRIMLDIPAIAVKLLHDLPVPLKQSFEEADRAAA